MLDELRFSDREMAPSQQLADIAMAEGLINRVVRGS